MNDVAMRPGTGVMELSEEELVSVLSNSIYPGAKLESIKMVLGYCKAAGLDPIQKPVHIVPMQVATGEKDSGGWDIKKTRDVVMPGIGLYRTQAARSGALGGISEPEFGTTVQLTLDGVVIDVPEWCRVTVYRLVSGTPCAFTAVERWLENYATKSAKSDAPNAMWKKRPFAQLAKCAEAQALRKAFPEVGSQATAEEMEGKVLDGEFEHEASTAAAGGAYKVGKRGAAIEHKPMPSVEEQIAGALQDGREYRAEQERESAQQAGGGKKRGASSAASKTAGNASSTTAAAPAASSSADFVGIGEQKYLENKAKAMNADLNAVLKDLGGLVLEKLTKADFEEVKRYLMDLGG